ncbi:MAG: response regulator transcription factor [Loktanella sp.]|nr:response regulator transcription factor [Loktanella sp.]
MIDTGKCKVAVLGKAYLVRSALQLIVSRLGLESVVAEDASELPKDVGVVLISFTSSQDIQSEMNACLSHLGSPRIVLLPQDFDVSYSLPDLPSEVAAVVSPGMGSDEIESVVLLVADGHRIVPFAHNDHRTTFKESDTSCFARDRLTKRQYEILTELAKGQTNKEIARCLNISTNTVEAHVSSIIRKLNVDNRTQAALTARQTLMHNQHHESAK